MHFNFVDKAQAIQVSYAVLWQLLFQLDVYVWVGDHSQPANNLVLCQLVDSKNFFCSFSVQVNLIFSTVL